MGLSSYYRGRLSYVEALELEMPHFHSLRHAMFVESKTKEGQENKAAEVLENEIVERMT